MNQQHAESKGVSHGITTAVIMAAGRGTRMKELTAATPKPLLMVDGKPFLLHSLERLYAAGFTRVVVVIGRHHEKFDALRVQVPQELALVFVDQFERIAEERYGTAMSVLAAEDAVRGEAFAVLSGDQLYSVHDLQRMRAEYNGTMIAGVQEHDHPEACGVAVLGEDDVLREFIEKPEHPQSNLVNQSMYAFAPDIFSALRNVGRSPRGEYELTDAVNALAAQGRVRVMRIEQPVFHLSTPDDLAAAEQFVRSVL